jgi:hypothetical protein
MRFNKKILGGGGIALVNNYADRQNPFWTRTVDQRPVTNSELVSAAVILTDLLFAEKMMGANAEIMDGAVAGATYRLAEALLAPAPEVPEPTSYPVSYPYQPPARYEAPPPAPASVSVPSGPRGQGVSVLEI